MKKKRSSRRKSTKPPPAGAPRRRQQAGAPAPARELRYKVVELSTVDEGSLERTFNEWTARGWSLDGVQFAMRESSKRPAMAFVFFTRDVEVSGDRALDGGDERSGDAREKLRQLAGLPRQEDGAAPGPAAAVESSVRTAVELAAAALFDVNPTEVAEAEGAGAAPDDENGAVRWVELAEENDE